MDIGIIGAGNIGGTLARLLTGAGHTVVIANSRGPETLTDVVSGVEGLRAGTVEEAADAVDLVIEAVPLKAVPDLPADALDGRILVSAANYYPDRDGPIDFDGRTQTEWVAARVPGARVVKAFNTIWFGHLAAQGDPGLPEEERRAIFLAGDDDAAKQIVADLIRELGFGPVDTGGLADGGARQEPGTPIYNAQLTVREARDRLSA